MSSLTTTPAPVSPTPKNITFLLPSSSPPPPTAQSPSSSTSPPPPKSFTSPPPPTTHSSSSPPPPPKTSNGSDTPSSTGINSSSSSSFATTAIVGVAVAGVVGVLLLCIVIACCCRKKRKTRPELLPVQDHGAPPQPSRGSKQQFTYEDLEKATNGFSQTNLLGEGGFGHVYKGILPGSKTIAVKKLKVDGRQVDVWQRERQFQAEVEIISRVHHCHLVSLVGYCIAGSQRLLVYEFVPNDTLEHHLHVEGQPTLDWPTRLKIATGAACGLAYLHEDCCPKIIHRDIKASNILLDSNFEAKIADFGLAKLVSESSTHIFTEVAGTPGYVDPEYFSTKKLTYKSDVYSFGVLLLELITGHKPVDKTQPSAECLVEWARPLLTRAIENGNVDDLADSRIQHNYNVDEMMRVVKCAASCVRRSARKRPRMGQIVRFLEGAASLDDPDEGVRPGHRSVCGSIGSSDYDTNQYSEDMKKFRKMAFGSQEHGSDYSGATNEFGFSSGEYRQDARTVGHHRTPSRSSLGSDCSGPSSEYGLNQSVSANMDDYYGGRPQYSQNTAPQPGDNAVKIRPPSSPLSHPVIPKPLSLPSPPDVMPPPPPPPPVSKQPLPPPSPGISLGISRTFTYEDLETATNGFSQTNLLGGRGSGHVYKGTLPGSKTIAVKQLKVGGSQGEAVRAVVEKLSRPNHCHLASFVGYCIAGSQLLLVYEFGPNDTLEHHLHVVRTMDWRTRFKIAKGAAYGLAYLHEDCRPMTIHGDIKASNIFLDSKYKAKVAGFGLTILVSERFPIVYPDFVRNSKEEAHEYAKRTDVYSFGVLLLELITGRLVDTISFPEESLVDWAQPLLARAMKHGNVDALGDIWSQHEYNEDEMMRVVACAASCVRRTGSGRRPSMRQIVHALEGLVSLDDL